MISEWSDFEPSRASEMIATGFAIRSCKPKFEPKLDKVGPATLWRPRSRVSTRPIVPLPPRFGPTSMNIFCCVVSPETRYPNIS